MLYDVNTRLDLISCVGESGNDSDDDAVIRYVVGITDVLDSMITSSSPRVEVMRDNKYNITIS
jgi:hypothetical protein